MNNAKGTRGILAENLKGNWWKKMWRELIKLINFDSKHKGGKNERGPTQTGGWVGGLRSELSCLYPQILFLLTAETNYWLRRVFCLKLLFLLLFFSFLAFMWILFLISIFVCVCFFVPTIAITDGWQVAPLMKGA